MERSETQLGCELLQRQISISQKANNKAKFPNSEMQKELECIKIKDGLYLGNVATAQDCQFLFTNKFEYIVNCTAQIPNFFEKCQFKYLKFKLVKGKAHKLWESESLKKLAKLHQFIQRCEQQSVCCLIHSYDGHNRSLVMLAAYLMSAFHWKLPKTLDFIRSKDVFIGLSDHNIDQLQDLETFLEQGRRLQLSSAWRIDYRSQEQEIVSKTFLNAQKEEFYQLKLKEKQPQNNNQITEGKQKKKNQRRVMWLDRIEKQKKKSLKQGPYFQKEEVVRTNLAAKEVIEQESKRQRADLQMQFQNQILYRNTKMVKGKKKPLMGSKKKIKNTESKRNATSKSELARPLKNKTNASQVEQLIRNRVNHMNAEKDKQVSSNSAPKEKNIQYNLTINNFIQPNINWIGNMGDKKLKASKQRPKSACQRQEKTNSNMQPQKAKRTFQMTKEYANKILMQQKQDKPVYFQMRKRK